MSADKFEEWAKHPDQSRFGPEGTAWTVRYPDGRIKCVAYQEPMPKSKVEQARAASGRARMAKVGGR